MNSSHLFANVLPRPLRPIPWGWCNVPVSDFVTFSVKPPGEIRMLQLLDYFDWNEFIIEGDPLLGFGTRNMKSIFTTAARFLGYERLLTEQPKLGEITASFKSWNDRLLDIWRGRLSYFLLGDDAAGNQGLFLSPERWREWLLPEYCQLIDRPLHWGVKCIFHSDGDIFDLLPDLERVGFWGVSYQPIGRLKNIGRFFHGLSMIPVSDQELTNANAMRLQR